MRPPSDCNFQLKWILWTFNIVLTLHAVFGFEDSDRDLRDQSNRDHYPIPAFIPSDTDNQTVVQGDTAVLPCGVMYLGTKTITWRRVGALNPITIGTMTFADNSEYEVLPHNQESSQWDLLIKNVQPKHEGGYECQISTKDKMKKIVHLHVTDNKRHSERMINISGQFHVDKGQPIKLRCNATGVGNPPDAIDWFKDGITLQTNHNKQLSISKKFALSTRTITSELEIENAQMSDMGTYTCRTSDLQVTSVNVNILNAEKPKTKREEEHLQATKLANNKTSEAIRYYWRLTDMCTLLMTASMAILFCS